MLPQNRLNIDRIQKLKRNGYSRCFIAGRSVLTPGVIRLEPSVGFRNFFIPANNPCTSQHVLLSGKEEDRREKPLSLLCDSAGNYHDDEGWVLSTHVGLICSGHGWHGILRPK